MPASDKDLFAIRQVHRINIPTIFSYVNIGQHSFSSVLFIMSVCSFIPVTSQSTEELASPAKLQSSLFVGGSRGLMGGFLSSGGKKEIWHLGGQRAVLWVLWNGMKKRGDFFFFFFKF